MNNNEKPKPSVIFMIAGLFFGLMVGCGGGSSGGGGSGGGGGGGGWGNSGRSARDRTHPITEHQLDILTDSAKQWQENNTQGKNFRELHGLEEGGH